MLTRIVIWIHEADSEPCAHTIMYILVDTSLLWFLFFFQTSKLHVFIKLHRNCQLLISLEQSKTPSMLINFGECDCQHIKIRNVKSLSSMYSVGKCINSSRFIITRSPSKVHILNLLMDTVYLSTSAYSVLCFFYEMDYYSVWIFIWSEYFGIRYFYIIYSYKHDCWRSI